MRIILASIGAAALIVTLTACGDDPQPAAPVAEPTLVPSLTFTPFVTNTIDAPSATPPPTATATSEDDGSAEITEEPRLQIVVDVAEGEGIEPPVSVTLPDGWRTGNSAKLIQDIVGEDVLSSLRVIPFTLYTGPVSGGEGFIILLWGFDSYQVANPLVDNAGQLDMWRDGLRLLRLAILEPECNIGTQDRLAFEIGDLPALGTFFAAVDCPETVDTRGWFAGLTQSNINFMFYVYTEPIDAMDGAAPDEMQAILDTVEFQVNNLILTVTAAAPEATP